LIISIDSNELYSDDGFVEKEILNAVSRRILQTEYDLPLLLIHYSILGTDSHGYLPVQVIVKVLHHVDDAVRSDFDNPVCHGGYKLMVIGSKEHHLPEGRQGVIQSRN